MNGSFKISGPHYFGVPVLKPEFVSNISRDLVKPEDNISGRTFLAPTVGSYGHAAPVLIQAKDACGNPIWENRTANNAFRSYDVPINGYFSPQVDDGIIRGNYQFPPIANWKAAGEQNQERGYVELSPETLPGIIIESFGERKLNVGEGTPVDLFVHDYQLQGIRNNRAGPAFHRVENLRQSFINYLGTKFAQNHYSRLAALGYKSENIGYLGVAFVDGVFYAVGRAPDGKIALSASIGTQTELEKLAKEWGLKPDDLRMDSFAEEITHIMRGSIDKVLSGQVGLIKEEIATKKMVRDSYLEEEKGAEGNPEAVAYWRRMAEFKQGKIQRTPKDYGKLARQGTWNLELIVEDSEEQSAFVDGRHTKHNITEYSDRAAVYTHKNKGVGSKRVGDKESKEKGKVLDAKDKFSKSKYDGRTAEADARNDGDAKACPEDSGEPKGESAEPGQAEASAEAA